MQPPTVDPGPVQESPRAVTIKMLLSDLLSPERIRCNVHSSSKKRLLETISKELARNSDDLSQREIFESLCARERLGSTGLGNGRTGPRTGAGAAASL